MKSGRTLTALAQELDRQLAGKKDYVVPSPLVHHTTREDGDTVLEIDAPETPRPFEVTPLARRQLADKLKIPLAYFERMRTEQPELLDRNVNTWLQQEEARPMLRTLDGRVRAVLSNRYRCLDNVDLAQSVLPILGQFQDGTFESVELTETRMYIKFVLPRLQYEMRVGDVVQAGIVVTNSEVGLGTLAVQPLVYRLVCSNGMIAADQSIRKTHLGRALGNDDGVTIFQEDTRQADDKAFFLQVRDVVRSALSEDTFRQIAMKMQKTMGIELKASPVKTVEVLRQRYTLSEEEGDGVLNHLIRGGDLSGYGLVNAVTRYSQDVEDYDRATEFEALGGKLIELSGREWKDLAEAA
ncbi:DUF932 domain-containing protein [Zoogloea sp.]|uniref:DUF932 domain-containing protein n=1 Tax=Zoogloea sp. TaxID=49181 RepID=UPI0025F0066A|nr:DUF932 domain-containing protein [Zoogloea sp.]MCK6392685.1 DUF945 domain-containing protein [Zoogloea sp.]MCK6407598.1 DUF945 domain-containing protein [Thauera sp.]